MARLSPTELRALFPAVTRASYLNAAAASPLATPVERAATDHLREAANWGDIGFPAWLKRKEEIRAQFAKLIRASAREVAFLPSTSMGFHVVGQLWKQRGVREVVTFEQEFPSTTLPLLHLGFRLKRVKPRRDGSYALEDVERAVGRPTGAVAVSAVQYASGFRADLRGLVKLCRAKKLSLAVNGAQALGQVPLEAASGIDFICGTSHKWLMGGYGVGLFCIRRALLTSSELPFAGWLSTPEPMKMDNREVRCRKEASALEVGCSAYAPLFSLGAAIELIQRVGIDRIESHNAKLQRILRARLRSLGFVPNAPDDPSLGSGICVFRVDGDPRRVARELAKKGVVVSPRGVGIRVSTHVYNAEEDLDQLFWAVDKLGIRPG